MRIEEIRAVANKHIETAVKKLNDLTPGSNFARCCAAPAQKPALAKNLYNKVASKDPHSAANAVYDHVLPLLLTAGAVLAGDVQKTPSKDVQSSQGCPGRQDQQQGRALDVT